MITFKPSLKRPGDTIRAEDWNSIQQGLLEEIERLRAEIYNMSESKVLVGVESSVGQAFSLDEHLRNEPDTYGEKTMGLITKQWVTAVPGEGEICSFGIMDTFDILYYWAGAVKGDKNTLDMTVDYMDRPSETVGKNLYINDRRAPPSDPVEGNPWLVALRSANDLYWYKYQIINPYPSNEVKYVNFINTNKECTPRIGNVIYLISKLRPIPKH